MKRLLLLGLTFGMAASSWAQLSWGVGIGQTYYDLHSNRSTGNRLVKNTDGSMSATWIEHWDVLNPDNTPKGNVRGFGYNHFDPTIGWVYGEVTPSEYYTGECWTDQYGCASQYVGWPEMINLDAANGNGNQEIVINHTPLKMTSRATIGGAADANGTATVDFGNTSQINGEQDMGLGTWDGTWPRAVASGDYIHLIVTSTDLNGFFDGNNPSVEMPCVYIRSTDGGVTWDAPMSFDVTGDQINQTVIPVVTIDSNSFTVDDSTLMYSMTGSWMDSVLTGTFTVGANTYNADSMFATDSVWLMGVPDTLVVVMANSAAGDTFSTRSYTEYDSVPVMDTTYGTITTYDTLYDTVTVNLVNSVGADAYAIATNGPNVAVTFGAGINNNWVMFKSGDNGSTWNRTWVRDNQNPDTAIIDGQGGWGAITNLANFDIMIDDNGLVHMAAGMGFPSDGGGVYIVGAADYMTGGPGWEESLGILYWNENMTDPQIAAYPDYGSDGNASDYNSHGTEFYGFVWQGWPSLSNDGNGGVQLIYSAVAEDQGADFITVNDDTLGYNDLYMVYSVDNGATWCKTSDPINIAADAYGEFGGTPTQDDLYPVSLSDASDNVVRFTWQGDYSRPGLALYDDTHPNDILNYIHYGALDISALTSCAVVIDETTLPPVNEVPDGIKKDVNTTINFAMVPNPAKDIVNFSADASISNVTVVNMFGQNVKNVAVNGVNTYTLNVADLAEGIYVVKVKTTEGTATEKLNIIK